MKRLLSASLISAAMLAALASPSFAQDSTAPPGNGAVDEYSEAIPTPEGDRSPTDGRESNGGSNGSGGSGGSGSGGSGGGGSSSGGGIPSDTQSDLAGSGADGQAAADLANGTGSGSGDSGSGSDESAGDVAGATESSTEGKPITAQIGDAVSGSDDGLGVALPILLALTFGGALAVLVVRFTGRKSS